MTVDGPDLVLALLSFGVGVYIEIGALFHRGPRRVLQLVLGAAFIWLGVFILLLTSHGGTS